MTDLRSADWHQVFENNEHTGHPVVLRLIGKDTKECLRPWVKRG